METDTSTKKSLVGTILDNKYSITDLLGQGGMSTVYKARHIYLNKDVAIKIMQDHLSGNMDGKLRFKREAQATASLDHPNIVAVTEFGVSEPGGEPYMVMDYLRGQSLGDFIKQKGRPDPTLALLIFKQVASALQHAHEKGILHRDLKPSNVMLVQSGTDNLLQAKVVDLGLARFLPGADAENKRLTAAGELVGSPFYMSPEQIRDETLDARSDIYSFGCLLYEVLTGVRPFIDTNAITVLSMHLYESPPPFGLVLKPNRVPPRLESMVMKCMEKSRSSRFQSMRDVCTYLDVTPIWEDGPAKSIPYNPVIAAAKPQEEAISGSSTVDPVQTSGFSYNRTLRLERPVLPEKKDYLSGLKTATSPFMTWAQPMLNVFRSSFEGKGISARRKRIVGTRVLIGCLGDSKELIAAADADFTKYAVYFKNVERRRSMNAQEFLVLLSTDQFDIVHLHGNFDSQAIFRDSTGFELRLSDVKRACDFAKVQLLWLASDNNLKWMKNHPALENPTFHLIITGERGKNFPKFLSTLLARIARGEPVVNAWDSYVPRHAQQDEYRVHCRLVAGIADTAFLP